MFWSKIMSTSCEIALRWMPQNTFDDKSMLVQVMAWCRQATGHYLNQCWWRSSTPYMIVRPQWVQLCSWPHFHIKQWGDITVWYHNVLYGVMNVCAISNLYTSYMNVSFFMQCRKDTKYICIMLSCVIYFVYHFALGGKVRLNERY